jgi:hypothetical protein
MMAIQPTLEFAVHAHSRAALIAMRPVPPAAGTLISVVASVTPQRGTVAGAVDVVEEEPQALTTSASATQMSERTGIEQPEITTECGVSVPEQTEGQARGALALVEDTDAVSVSRPNARGCFVSGPVRRD